VAERGRELHLAHDVLDKQMVDRRGCKCGRVDGLVLNVNGDGPPRVSHIQIGAGTLAARLSPRLGRWAAAFARWLGLRARPYRLPWSRVESVDVDVTLDLDASRSGLDAAERWLRAHVIEHLPGR
jgi:hypothetical protein